MATETLTALWSKNPASVVVMNYPDLSMLKSHSAWVPHKTLLECSMANLFLIWISWLFYFTLLAITDRLSSSL